MTFTIPESVRCMDGVKYDDIKYSTHFEWVVKLEEKTKQLVSDVFETLGLKDEYALNLAVKGVDDFQENLRTKVLALVKQLSTNTDINDDAKNFATDWSQALQYQISQKYHLMGGPDAQKLFWVYTTSMQYITVCSTGLAAKDENVEFKKEVSKFSEGVHQYLIDTLQNIKSKLSTHYKS